MRRTLLCVLAISGLCAISAPDALNAQRQPTPCANKPSADTLVFGEEALDNLPVLRKSPVPHFSVMPQLGTQLRVRLAFVVNQDGSVDSSSIRLLDSTRSAFDQDARHYATALSFWPGCHEGNAVRARIVFPLDYGRIISGRGPIG